MITEFTNSKIKTATAKSVIMLSHFFQHVTDNLFKDSRLSMLKSGWCQGDEAIKIWSGIRRLRANRWNFMGSGGAARWHCVPGRLVL